MTFPYITIDDRGEKRCLCKGCGAVLWSEQPRGFTRMIRPEYGDLTIAMSSFGELTQHTTPCCPDCAADALEDKVPLLDWFIADVFHWYLEEIGRGTDALLAERRALEHAYRDPVRALGYAPYVP